MRPAPLQLSCCSVLTGDGAASVQRASRVRVSAGRAPGLQGPAMWLRSAEGTARGPATNSRSGARFPWDTAGEKEREAQAWGRSPPSASGHLLSEQGPQPAAGPGASWRRLRRASPDRGSPRVRGRGRAVEGPWGGPPPRPSAEPPTSPVSQQSRPASPLPTPRALGPMARAARGYAAPNLQLGVGVGFTHVATLGCRRRPQRHSLP